MSFLKGRWLSPKSVSQTSKKHLLQKSNQEAFSCQLPPTLLPLNEFHDYDLIKILFNRMMKTEGMDTDWQPGQDPPAKVRQYGGVKTTKICFGCISTRTFPRSWWTLCAPGTSTSGRTQSCSSRHTGQEEGETISHLLTRASVLLQKGLSALLLNRIPSFPTPAIAGTQ